jgi:signal peptide peptidase SppA
MPLVHLASRLVGTPLLIARAKLEVILAVLGPRLGLPVADAALPVAVPSRTETFTAPGIAVLPIHGTLVRRTQGLEAASGLTSYEAIGVQLDAALADPAIHGILLDVDSPGGEAGGVFELAERIRAADAVKPVWALAAESAFSAAYALAAGASQLALTRTAGVGSIGVIALHLDQSGHDAQQGYRYTAITAGKHKNDFSPHAPLDPQAAERLQAEVDRLYGMFLTHVAAMRGLDPEAVRATEAGLYFGEDAVAAGLADAVASREAFLAQFITTVQPQGRSRNPVLHTAAGSALTLPENTFMDMHDPIPTASESALESTREPVIEPTHDTEPAPEPVIEPTSDTEEPASEPPASPAAVRQEAVAIAELCVLSGCPERTAEFLSRGLSEAEVRRTLLSARAANEAPEIRSAIHPDAHVTQRSAPDHNPLIQAVKHLTGKE